MTPESIPSGSAEPAHAETKRPYLNAGPLDVIFIYHKVDSDTYHPVYYRERPMPGPIQPHDQLDIVRLASSMHHTQGSPTIEGAQQLLRDLRELIAIDDMNVDTEHPVPWDGELGDIMILPNWRRQGEERPFGSLLEVL